uniref:Glycosyltransferase 2-like domain-containing protein n=1 Tax=Ditylum brightwellii TaxID=49249 RepID=A0A7S4QDP8_9STRA
MHQSNMPKNTSQSSLSSLLTVALLLLQCTFTIAIKIKSCHDSVGTCMNAQSNKQEQPCKHLLNKSSSILPLQQKRYQWKKSRRWTQPSSSSFPCVSTTTMMHHDLCAFIHRKHTGTNNNHQRNQGSIIPTTFNKIISTSFTMMQMTNNKIDEKNEYSSIHQNIHWEEKWNANKQQLDEKTTFALSASPPPPPLPSNLIVIIPAYNEYDRLPNTLHNYVSYLNSSPLWGRGSGQLDNDQKGDDSCCHSSILVVDDGSTDGTFQLIQNLYGTQNDDDDDKIKHGNYYNDGARGGVQVKCISLPQNEGKGSAIAYGLSKIECSDNKDDTIVLVADADGSGDITYLDDMVVSLASLIIKRKSCSSSPPPNDDSNDIWNTPACVIGNRGNDSSSLKRSILRWGFRTTVKLFCNDLGVSDTQCGFKLYTANAATVLYKDLNLKRWSHDVEVLYRARELGMAADEMEVGWVDMEGSKLVGSVSSSSFPFSSFFKESGGIVVVSMQMLLEVLWMRFQYIFGRWRV